MIKKILLAFAMMLPMFASAQILKVGIVDVTDIIGNMPETKAAQAKIDEAGKRYEAEYTKLGEEMQRKYEEFQKMREDELPAIKETKARELGEYQQKIQAFEQQAQQSLAKIQQDEMTPIIAKVRSAIETVAKDEGFSMIQTYDPQLTLYYAAPVVNITDKVKAKLGIK